MKKPKVGQAVVFRGAVATIAAVSAKQDSPDGSYRSLVLDTHRGRVYNVWTDHPHLHIP